MRQNRGVSRAWAGLSLAFEQAFGAEARASVKDGGEPPIKTCTECGEETYAVAEAGCATYVFQVPEDESCAICNERLSVDDNSEHDYLCNYHAP
jgi:hypothetical protein